MKTLQEIKDEVVKEAGYKDWKAYNDFTLISNTMLERVAKRYAEEALREAAEKARVYNSCNVWNCEGESINKDSILNIIKELK